MYRTDAIRRRVGWLDMAGGNVFVFALITLCLIIGSVKKYCANGYYAAVQNNGKDVQ